ncbi:MAG: KpsF/GutQ family sugar-phosphate isomerase [Proteobacteria bacterium]|nr:KpsF/GutQ family sugar-phosphate isomerase [Pseudomonadota bacterium]
MSNDEVIEKARNLLNIEADAVRRCAARLDNNFLEAIKLLRKCIENRNKIVFMGVGKSHYVAAKLSASLMSTGATSVFVHPAEAFHGDLGVISSGDVCICISKSGSTAEILGLLPFFKNRNPVISITGNLKSALALKSDVVLDASVEQEACPINLLPTASTTTALALGDALVSVIAEDRGFDKKTFAGFHPGGSLGKRLNQKVEDVIINIQKVPFGPSETPLTQVAQMMSDKPVGAFCVLDSKTTLIGIVTDGDIRRAFAKSSANSLKAVDVMNAKPVCLSTDLLLDEALAVMEQPDKKIQCAPVTDSTGRLLGIVRLHDLI